jgi:hypothetical protein
MKFIKPNLVYSPGLSIGQDDDFANKLGLSFIEFGEDCARSRFGAWHEVARMGCKGAPASHRKACNSWQTHGNGMSMELHPGGRLACVADHRRRVIGEYPRHGGRLPT